MVMVEVARRAGHLSARIQAAFPEQPNGTETTRVKRRRRHGPYLAVCECVCACVYHKGARSLRVGVEQPGAHGRRCCVSQAKQIGREATAGCVERFAGTWFPAEESRICTRACHVRG